MTPEEKAEAVWQQWISEAGGEVRRLVEGTPLQARFLELVTAAISNTQQTVALGTGSAEIQQPE